MGYTIEMISSEREITTNSTQSTRLAVWATAATRGNAFPKARQLGIIIVNKDRIGLGHATRNQSHPHRQRDQHTDASN